MICAIQEQNIIIIIIIIIIMRLLPMLSKVTTMPTKKEIVVSYQFHSCPLQIQQHIGTCKMSAC